MRSRLRRRRRPSKAAPKKAVAKAGVENTGGIERRRVDETSTHASTPVMESRAVAAKQQEDASDRDDDHRMSRAAR